jgi:FixJ family two-component response regulator
VYVVDDEPGVRRSLTRLIRTFDLEVMAFASAEQFLASAPFDDKPSCALVDLVLKAQTGLDLQDQLRHGGIEMPLIFMSGRGDLGSGVRAMKGGALDFLEKPISQEALEAAVTRALNHDRRGRAERTEQKRLAGLAEKLTARERQVFGLLADGLANKEVGAKLGTTEKTVKVHRARVMEKMEADSFAGLVRMADRLGL